MALAGPRTAATPEESGDRGTIDGVTARRIRVRADDADGRVFGGFLEPGVSTPTDTCAGSGSPDGFFDRSERASGGMHAGLPASATLSLDEIRDLMEAAEDADASQRVIAGEALRTRIDEPLARRPDDPGLAYLKRKAWSPEYVRSLVCRGHRFPLDALPAWRWTAGGALEMVHACGQVRGLGERLCAQNRLRAADLGEADVRGLLGNLGAPAVRGLARRRAPPR